VSVQSLTPSFFNILYIIIIYNILLYSGVRDFFFFFVEEKSNSLLQTRKHLEQELKIKEQVALTEQFQQYRGGFLPTKSPHQITGGQP
jgi:uncharacterized protein YbgA (DUF1722 family)